MELAFEPTAEEENKRLKAELVEARTGVVAAKRDRALRDENDQLARQVAALRAEKADVEGGDVRIPALTAIGFAEKEAKGLLLLLDAPEATVISLDALGRLASHAGTSLSTMLLLIRTHIL
jgi:hypothetical protein